MVAGVGAVVVTYDSHPLVGDLLDDLRRLEPRVSVVVVDSASPRGPPPTGHAELIVLEENRGYAVACNTGAQRLLEGGLECLAFLNPDVRLCGPSLTELANELLAIPEAGIATGPVVDGVGRRTPSAWGPASSLRALWFASGTEASRLRASVGLFLRSGIATSGASTRVERMRVDGHVLGGAMVVRAECFQQLGGLDEGFFMYWEDADLCHRARAAGWEVWLLPCTPMVHRAGTSSVGISSEQRWLWYLEGAERFADRHLDPAARWRLLAALRLGRRLGDRR